MTRRYLLTLSLIYRILYKVHHWLFLRPGKPLVHAKLIVVGTFLAGGAGKTPFVIWLANHIADLSKKETGARVAILCHLRATDEFELIRTKLPWATVVATANRYRTARKMDTQFDYIICDDGFEDSRLRPALTVRLDWTDPPCHLRDLWPAGANRSLVHDHPQPDVVLKCGGDNPDVRFSISEIVNGVGERLNLDDCKGHGLWAVCGLGNPSRFFKNLAVFGVNVEHTVSRPDHDSRFDDAVRKALKTADRVVLTEKDAMRLKDDLQKSRCVYRCLQKVEVNPRWIGSTRMPGIF